LWTAGILYVVIQFFILHYYFVISSRNSILDRMFESIDSACRVGYVVVNCLCVAADPKPDVAPTHTAVTKPVAKTARVVVSWIADVFTSRRFHLTDL
jgi:hypothetical protein